MVLVISLPEICDHPDKLYQEGEETNPPSRLRCIDFGKSPGRRPQHENRQEIIDLSACCKPVEAALQPTMAQRKRTCPAAARLNIPMRVAPYLKLGP